MLDTVTKRRIDTARDILVGKVPDPKSQVEQITIALIYKFMDDMDAQAEEIGGKRKFFVGDYVKYGWANLMAPSTSGEERIALYAEGMIKMALNTSLPKLFRDIFKNAFLPYRDPETLRLFLRTIDEFEYDHSERLGDAFEYLLSILGSQGDAGQFRTPRHIIDFIIAIVDPKKNETVLDPACGTGGFLISAYKHILHANSTKRVAHASISKTTPNVSTTIKGDLLTPNERKKLAQNFRGYDISPDMVRLSLMNMYLHGFTSPQIDEYDTLTNQDRWNEMADVILANPPFMSPKGGIKPHNRFSVQSKRSEVLFIDYIAEHLTLGGRAGVIVPEGVIFQSQNTYKTLREMLVKQYLIAVISLPAGVFQPYSGVKTSILILDKSLAKQSDTIGFFKIEKDGYNLGAQRRKLCNDKGDEPQLCPTHSDIPQVVADVDEYLRRLRMKESIEVSQFRPSRGLIVSKEKIAANGDYNLSGERYKSIDESSLAFPLVELGDLFDITSSKRVFESDWADSGVPFFRARELVTIARDGFVRNELFISEELYKKYSTTYGAPSPGDMLVTGVGTLGVCYVVKDGDRFYFKDGNIIWLKRKTDTLTEFVQYLFQSPQLRQQIEANTGSTVGTYTIINAKRTKIPLPPVEVQKEIVAEIERYQRVIDGAKLTVANYCPSIPNHPDWQKVELGELCEIRSGGTPKREVAAYWNGDIPWITTSLIDFNVIERAEEFITKAGLENSSAWIAPKGTVVMAMYGQGVTRGRVAILGIDASMNQACAAFTIRNQRIISNYLYHALEAEYKNLRELSDARGGNQSNLSGTLLKQYVIPLPPLTTQRKIISEIEAEQRLVEGNRELIKRMEKKISAILTRVWGTRDHDDV